jgi:hypothetical protein
MKPIFNLVHSNEIAITNSAYTSLPLLLILCIAQALGCSSVTPDWLLEKQADILESLTRFFHCDIQTILKSSNFDRELLSTKLTSMMDHYIPISQHHGDLFALTFGILPILYLPKVELSLENPRQLILIRTVRLAVNRDISMVLSDIR